MKRKKLLSLLLSILSISYSYLEAGDENLNQPFTIIEDKTNLLILNPSLSSRQFRKIRLDNGLQVYIISDPGAEQSAAALSVEAGSWDDPKEYPGMAHFLEHMLFMGTAAYPKESEYMQYVNDHGGRVNASTWPDRTIYMFSINNDAFEGTLDRFSHFFIDPLFSLSCIDRELHAVDQEHAKNIEHDGWREYMIFKETGNPLHPNAAFSTGNAQTLSGIPSSALKQWYEKYYDASRMHLIVTSPLSLDTLTSLIVQDFSKVKTRDHEKQPVTVPMFSAKQTGQMIYIKPVKDLKRISLLWEIPQEFASDKERNPAKLAAYILENESSSSLISQLKRENLAESLEVVIDKFSSNQTLFRIDISLTQYGVTQIDTVILRCFQTLAQMKQKELSPHFFEEIQKMALLKYQYQSREDAFTFVMQHAIDLIDEDLSTYPQKTLIPTTYDPTYFSSFLQTLTPQSCSYFVTADPKLVHIQTSVKEKWMGAEYAIKAVQESNLKLWSHAEVHPNINLPPSNPFLPQNLALITSPSSSSTPTLISNDEFGKVYFLHDDHYLVPELSAIFGFKTPLVDGCSKSIALTDLYLKALNENLSSTLSFAEVAGLDPTFTTKDLKITVAVQGYSEKAPLLLKEIFQNLKTVTPTFEQFETYKHFLANTYENASKELPVKQASDLLASVIYNGMSTNTDKLKALQTISYEDFLQFSKTIFKTAYIEGFIYGNLLETTAQTLWTELKSTVAINPYPIENQVPNHVLILPDKHGPYMLIQGTERQGNGVVLLIEEGSFSFEKRSGQQILSKALKEAFFDTLRTKQQTGYIAQAWDTEVEGQLLQFFAVQSNTHHCSELIARFELFLEDFLRNLPDTIPLERFETIRKMLITTLQMPPENLKAMSLRLYNLAFEYDGDFNWIEKRIDNLKSFTYDQFIDFTEQAISRENSKRIAVLIEGVLPPQNDFHYEHVSKSDICDIGTYVSWK